LPPELLNDPRINFIYGGRTRGESVYNALMGLSVYEPESLSDLAVHKHQDSGAKSHASFFDYVLIHDGCRPFVSARLIQRIMDEVQQHQAVIPLVPLTDTPKEISFPLSDESPAAVVTRHLRRDMSGLAQTPQAFAFPEIFTAYKKAAQQQEDAPLFSYTDDAEVWGEFCGPVAVVPGEAENRKITFPDDLE